MHIDIFLDTHVVQVEQVNSNMREAIDLNMLAKNIINHINLVPQQWGYNMQQ